VPNREDWQLNDMLSRRDRRMDRKEKERNRPHFSLVDVVLHPHEIQLVELVPNELQGAQIKPAVRNLRVGVVKAIVRNEGMMNAKNARALSYLYLGEGVKGDTTNYVIWGPIRKPVKPDVVYLPAWAGLEKMDIRKLAEVLRDEYFSDNTNYTMTTKMEVAPTFLSSACLLYTIEGDDRTYIPTVEPNSRPLPLETKISLDIVMDDEEPTHLDAGKLILKSWNDMAYEKPA
jgi:hypothetical protein